MPDAGLFADARDTVAKRLRGRLDMGDRRSDDDPDVIRGHHFSIRVF
jgi:hypothetical protein